MSRLRVETTVEALRPVVRWCLLSPSGRDSNSRIERRLGNKDLHPAVESEPGHSIGWVHIRHRMQPYSGRAKDTLKQGEVRGVGKLKAAEFVHSEPADCIVLFWLAILHPTDPGATNPHGEVQAIVRIGLPKDGLSVDISKMDAELLAELSPECVGPALPRFDVTAREVPDIRIPTPSG